MSVYTKPYKNHSYVVIVQAKCTHVMVAIVPNVEWALKETVHEMGLQELKPRQTEAVLH